MKIKSFVLALVAISLTACSTTKQAQHVRGRPDPETVMVTYRVKPGDEAELQSMLGHAWEVYRKEHLVYAEPHIVLLQSEDGEKSSYIEIFTWANRATLEHAPDSIKAIWQQEHTLCEARNGHSGIEGVEVRMVTGAHHTMRWP